MITAQWREAQDRWWTCTEEGFLIPTTEVKFIAGSCLFPQVLLCSFLEQYSLFRSVRTTSLLSSRCVSGSPRGHLCHLHGWSALGLDFHPHCQGESAAVPLWQFGPIQSLGKTGMVKFVRYYIFQSYLVLSYQSWLLGEFLNPGT